MQRGRHRPGPAGLPVADPDRAGRLRPARRRHPGGGPDEEDPPPVLRHPVADRVDQRHRDLVAEPAEVAGDLLQVPAAEVLRQALHVLRHEAGRPQFADRAEHGAVQAVARVVGPLRARLGEALAGEAAEHHVDRPELAPPGGEVGPGDVAEHGRRAEVGRVHRGRRRVQVDRPHDREPGPGEPQVHAAAAAEQAHRAEHAPPWSGWPGRLARVWLAVTGRLAPGHLLLRWRWPAAP